LAKDEGFAFGFSGLDFNCCDEAGEGEAEYNYYGEVPIIPTKYQRLAKKPIYIYI